MPDVFIIEAMGEDGSQIPFFVDVSSFNPVDAHGYAVKQAARVCQRPGVVGCKMWQATAEDAAELGARQIPKKVQKTPGGFGLLRVLRRTGS